MADKTYTLEVVAKGLREAAKGLEELNKQGDSLQATQSKTSKVNKTYSKSAAEVIEQNKGVSFSTNNSTHAFSKMATNMQGTLVPAYATVAANVFALTAAFGALERAADFSILVNSAKELATQTGRSLVTLAEGMKEVTGSAISMKEALTSASIAASAGFDNETILRLTQVARNASVALGREMTDALNRVFKGAIKAEPELLDELGIILRLDTASRKYAATLGKTVQQLTTFEKQQAVVNDVIEQGEKKFGRLAEVDPNPYTQLAAAFKDISTELVNLVGLPIGETFSFLAENGTALTAVMVLFATNVTKYMFPALQNLSDVIDKKLIASMTKYETKLQVINAQRLKIIDAAEAKRVERTLEKIDSVIDDTALSLERLGIEGTKGFKKLEHAELNAKQKLETFVKVYKYTLTQLKQGIPHQGFDATVANVKRLEDALARANYQLDIIGGAKSKTAFLNFNESIARARFGLTDFIAEIKTASLETTKFVNESTLGFTGLYRGIVATAAATTGLTRVVAVLSSAVTGLLATLYKLIGPIFTVIFAFELLSSAISYVYELFAGKPEADLGATLDGLEGQLEDVTKASINYRENMQGLPRTIDNITEEVTLQANALGELSSALSKVTTDLKVLGGFDTIDTLLNTLTFGLLGNISKLRDRTIEATEALKNLGYQTQVNKLIADFGEVSELSAKELAKFNFALKDSVTELNKIEQEYKNVIDALNTNVEKLNKSLTSVSFGFGKLTDAEESFYALNEISSIFESLSLDVISIGTTFDKLSQTGITMLGLDDELENFNRLKIGLDALVKQKDKLEAEKSVLTIVDQQQITELNRQIYGIDNAIRDVRNGMQQLGSSMNAAMQEGLNTFDLLINATNKYNETKKVIRLTDTFNLNTTKDFIDILDLSLKNEQEFLRSSSNVIQANLDKQIEALKTAKATTKTVEANKALLEARTPEDTEAIKKAETSVANAKLVESSIEQSIKKLETSVINTQVKGTQLLLSDVVKLEKEFNKFSDLAVFGSKVFDEELRNLEISLISRLRELYPTLNIKALEQQVKEFALRLRKEQAFEVELSLIGISGIEDVVKQTNKIIQDTAELTRETVAINALRASEEGTEETFRTDYKSIVDERIALDRLHELEKLDIANRDAEQQFYLFDLIEAQEEKITAIRKRRAAETAAAAANELVDIQKKLFLAKKEAAYGNQLYKLDKQRIQLEELRAKHAGANDLDEIIDKQKELNSLVNKMDFANQMKEGAAAMNDLAGAMDTFFENMQLAEGNPFTEMVSGLLLLQEVSGKMDTSLGKLGKGFATVGLAVANYSTQLKGIDESLASGKIDETTAAMKQQQAALSLGANAAGAMAGAFEEGSTAAKAFTIVQQGLAIASAAVAVLQQGQGEPYSAFARIAAMLSLVATILGAFGISGGNATSSEGPSVTETFRNENIGEQGVYGRTLKTNTLIDSVEELVSIDTKLYGVTRDLEITMSKMTSIFENLAAILIGTYSSIGGVSGLSTQGIQGYDVTSTLGDIGNDIASVVDDFISIISLGLINDVFGGLFSNTRTINRTLIDAGIEFQVSLNSLGDSLTGSLDAFIFTVENVEDRTTHTFHSDSVTNYVDDLLYELDMSVQTAFELTFREVLNGINLLITEFATNAEGINLEALFAGIGDLDVSGRTTLLNDELENMTDEEAAKAIAAYFSGITADISKTIFPFLADFQRAGEELGDTLIRLTTESIIVNDALATVGATISDYTAIEIDQADINKLIATGLEIRSSDISAIEAQIAKEQSKTYSSIWGIFTNNLIDAAVTSLMELMNDVATKAEIEAAAYAAAEAFKVEAVAAWDEALLSQFKDAEEFNEIFNTFSNTIFDESEMAGFAIEQATTSLESGFEDLISQAEAMGRGDLAAILQEGITPESLRQFYELADATGAFAVSADFATGAINTAGADLLGTAVSLGPAFELLEDSQAILDDLMEAIEDLNNEYVQQIALFGKVGKEAELLALSFDFAEAIVEAQETGSDLALVEEAYGLERLDIINKYYNQINDEINDTMSNILESVIEVSQNADLWDEMAFSVIKINKLVTQLSKGTSGIDLSSLTTDTTEFTEFINEFQEVIDSITETGPGSVSEEIALVDDLRSAIMDRYSLELSLLEEQQQAYKELSIEIQGYLDDLLLSDQSPLTNFERFSEAEAQFLTNAANVFSEDEDVAAQATSDLLDSADNFLEAASGFYAIGPEYQKVFDLVTTTLSNLDTELLVKKDETVLAIEQLNIDTIEQLAVLDDILVELKSQNQDTLIVDTAAAITEGMTPLMDEVINKLQSIDDGTWTDMLGVLEIIAATGLASTGSVETIVTPDNTFDYNTLTGIIESTPIEITVIPTDPVILFDPVINDSLASMITLIDSTNTLIATGNEQILALFDSLFTPTTENITQISTVAPDTTTVSIEPDITLGSFATGATEIPYDMVVKVHEGETIVPESMAEGIRNGTLNLGNEQDNSDIIEAIKELTGILAISQEDIVDATNRNVEASREIANSLSQTRQPVKTRGVL